MEKLKRDRWEGMSWRAFATLILVILCLLMLVILGWGLVTRELILGIISGLLVLGTAGIWVSYVAENEARKALSDVSQAVRESAEVLQECERLSISRIFPSSDANDFHSFLLAELDRSSSEAEVRVLAICARDLLHTDGGFAYHAVKESLARGRRLRVILAHPCFEFAVSRGITEDPVRRNFADYSRTVLVNDVLQSCEGALALGDGVKARLCPTTIYCNTLFINNVVVFEPYHFGVGHERASIDTPALVVGDQSRFSTKLSGQFELLWKRSERYALSQEFVAKLRRTIEAVADERTLVDFLKVSSPELF